MSEVPPFDSLKEQFSATAMALNPAELHGVLCALLSFDPETDVETWLVAAMGESFALHELDGELRQSLYWLFDWAQDNLSDKEFGFRLLVPDDAAGLNERISALSAWGSGFLAGVGHMAQDLDQLAPEIGEFVSDLTEIVRADHDADDGDEEAEDQYFELAEYVRLGAMMTFDALSEEVSQAAPDGTLLH